MPDDAPTETFLNVLEYDILPGFMAHFMTAYRDNERASAEEPGVLSTRIGRPMDTTRPDTVVIVWTFASYAAFQEHLLADHVQRYARLTGHMITDRRMVPCEIA